jgi:hypothetical protein
LPESVLRSKPAAAVPVVKFLLSIASESITSPSSLLPYSLLLT